MSKSTMVELVEELEKRNEDGKYDSIITEAKAGEFHDFKNRKYTCGKIALVSYLSEFPELKDIRDEIVSGAYDESPDEEDKDMLRDDLSKTPGGDAIMKALGLDKKE